MKHFLPAAACFCLSALLMTLPGVRFTAALFAALGGLWLLWLALRTLAEKYRFFKACKVIFLVGFFGVTAVLLALEGMILSYGEESYLGKEADAVIVLGAGVNGTTPSAALRSRIDAAAAFIYENPGIPVVLSGGQGGGEDITEAACMHRELLSHSLRPEGDETFFLLEERSTSTSENFAFSKAMLQDWGLDTDRAVIAVVTNDFHCYRSRFIAQREGLTTFGVPAELPWKWLTANYYLRESFALVKTALFD